MKALAAAAFASFTLGCAFSPNNLAQAHQDVDGEELGATLKVIQQSPVVATIVLKPKVDFARVEVGVGRNAIGGPRTVCVLSGVIQNQTYSCQLSGDVVATDTGLVLTVFGMTTKGSGVNKAFTVLNPKYDRNADREIQKQLSRGDQTLVIQQDPR